MALVSRGLGLRGIRSLTRAQWLRDTQDTGGCERLIVVTSGYESRSKYWSEGVIDRLPPSEHTEYLVLGFRDFDEALSRKENDKFYESHGLIPQVVDSRERENVTRLVREAVGQMFARGGASRVEVHVDYSCMPRKWYCELPTVIGSALGARGSAYFWYTDGVYPETDYPTAGIEDFQVFSGRPSLGASFRTHMFGLGFDRIRSQAIWSIIDPQNLVCFFADPAVKPEYVERVKQDNRLVLSAARLSFSVPLNDFVSAYSRIAAVATEYREIGDVVLVPDGPKPLILAASLVPIRLGRNGITCVHVARRKNEDFIPVDVLPLGDPVGFCFEGEVDE
jgi:hypothetical protein